MQWPSRHVAASGGSDTSHVTQSTRWQPIAMETAPIWFRFTATMFLSEGVSQPQQVERISLQSAGSEHAAGESPVSQAP